MAEDLIPAERHEYIVKQVAEKQIIRVSELSKMLGVSELTIRRDLDHLEKRGVLERTHGGATATHRILHEALYNQKNQFEKVEKATIGKVAASFVESGDTVLMNAGSTTYEVFRHLDKKGICIVTNNLGALSALEGKDVELILTGGNYRRNSNSLSGRFAESVLNLVYGSKAIIGVDGISCKYGLTTASQIEAGFNRLILERTNGPKIVVASHSKFGVIASFVSAAIEDIDIIVTDSGFDSSYRECFESAGVKVVVAEE